MPQNTFDYMDELQKRIDEVLARPMQGDYQEGPGAIASWWDLMKQGLNEALQWRAGQTTPYNMEAYMNPSDEQLMGMIPMAGAARKVNPWASAKEGVQRMPTKWGVKGQHYKSPFEGMTNDAWVSAKSTANDAIDDIMSRFSAAGTRRPPTKVGPSEMPWDEVMQKAGISPDELSRFPEPKTSYANQPSETIWPEAGTSMWNQPAFNILAELINAYTPQPIARGIKAYQDLPNELKGFMGLLGGGAVAGHAMMSDKPGGRFSGGAEAAQLQPRRQLREYVNPEQQRAIDEGIPLSAPQTRGADVGWGNIIRDMIYDNLIASRTR